VLVESGQAPVRPPRVGQFITLESLRFRRGIARQSSRPACRDFSRDFSVRENLGLESFHAVVDQIKEGLLDLWRIRRIEDQRPPRLCTIQKRVEVRRLHLALEVLEWMLFAQRMKPEAGDIDQQDSFIFDHFDRLSAEHSNAFKPILRLPFQPSLESVL
jgi:hypothetical protein